MGVDDGLKGPSLSSVSPGSGGTVLPMKRLPALLAALTLVLIAGCGDDETSKPSKPTGRSDTAATDKSTKALCTKMDDAESIDEFADDLPEQHRRAAEVLDGMAGAIDGKDETDLGGLLEDLVVSAKELESFSAWVEETCGADSEAAVGLRLLPTVAEFASVPADEDYCDALRTTFDSDEAAGAPDFSPLLDAAPKAHLKALERIAALADATEEPDAEVAEELGAGLLGIGMYAEARCGVEGATAQMGLAGAFLMAGDDLGGKSNPGTVDQEPQPADPAGATNQLPPGSQVGFEVVTVVLDEEAGRKASIVVPSGWEINDDFNVSIEPPSGSAFGFMTSISLDDGCDGMCVANDWEERLRGEDGYIPMVTADHDVIEDRVPAGSDGAVLVLAEDGVASRSVVLRWDDEVDHYFRCEAMVDEDDAELLAALTTACEAARPNWFPVEG